MIQQLPPARPINVMASSRRAGAWRARYSQRPMTASIDPSLRFVLSEESLYLKNMATLWAVQPDLAREIEALPMEELEGSYEIEPSKSGLPTLKVQTRDGRNVYLHSRYQPIDEANQLID